MGGPEFGTGLAALGGALTTSGALGWHMTASIGGADMPGKLIWNHMLLIGIAYSQIVLKLLPFFVHKSCHNCVELLLWVGSVCRRFHA